jgi:hypothetical protein
MRFQFLALLIAAAPIAAAADSEWTIGFDLDAKSPTLAGTIERDAGMRTYRLTVRCDALEDNMWTLELSWTPQVPASTLQVSVDGQAPVAYAVTDPKAASIMLRAASGGTRFGWPKKSLKVSGLAPGEDVEFPFDVAPLAPGFAICGLK